MEAVLAPPPGISAVLLDMYHTAGRQCMDDHFSVFRLKLCGCSGWLLCTGGAVQACRTQTKSPWLDEVTSVRLSMASAVDLRFAVGQTFRFLML